MGMDLIAYRKPNIQYGMRETRIEPKYVDSYKIWNEWSDSNVYSWPDCLQNFWWKIYDYDSAHECARNIRKYYSFDKELINFACWLEKMGIDIIFELHL